MVDPLNPRALFLQVADALAERIAAGEWAPGERMPSEVTLAGEYGVARATVRLALGELRERGAVVTAPKRGTYVARRGGRK